MAERKAPGPLYPPEKSDGLPVFFDQISVLTDRAGVNQDFPVRKSSVIFINSSQPIPLSGGGKTLDEGKNE